MPSTSKKQHNFMAAIANNPAFAKKVGIKPSVGEHFLTADKGKKFKEGGAMKHDDKKEDMAMDKAQDKAMIKKAVGMHDKQQHGGKKTSLAELKKGGMAKKMARGGGIEIKGKTKGKMVTMKKGGKC
jgi:ribosomal protein L13E